MLDVGSGGVSVGGGLRSVGAVSVSGVATVHGGLHGSAGTPPHAPRRTLHIMISQFS